MDGVKVKNPGISDECIELTVLPVSGGHFVNQVALLSLLCDNGYKPKILLGSSGGVVTAYIGLCADWKYSGIMRVMKNVSSDIFVSSWWGKTLGPYIPSGTIGIFKGALFKHGKGAGSLLEKYLTPDSTVRSEIWAGTYNKDTGVAAMFCNRSYEKSYIKSQDDNPSMPIMIKYLDGNINDIALSTYASSCIPAFLPPVEIDGDKYYDGGLVSASPLIPLSDSLPNCLKIIYISSFDVEEGKADMVDCSNIIQIGLGTVGKTVTGLCMADRIFAVRLVMKSTKMHFTYLHDIKEALKIYKFAERAVLELYPRKDLQVNITNFDSRDTIPIIKEIRENYGIRLWWID